MLHSLETENFSLVYSYKKKKQNIAYYCLTGDILSYHHISVSKES